MDCKFAALNEHVIIEEVGKEDEGYVRDKETGRIVKELESGIVIAKTEDSRSKRLYSIGVIRSSGLGKVSGGKRVPNQCQEGDKVYFYPDICIKLDIEEGKDLYLTKEEQVMAKVKE